MTNTPTPDELAQAVAVLETSRGALRQTLREAREHRDSAMAAEVQARADLNRVLVSAIANDHGLTVTRIGQLAKVGRSKLYSLPDYKPKDLPKFKSDAELVAALQKAGQARLDAKARSDQARRDALDEVIAARASGLLDVTEIVGIVGIDRTMAYRQADLDAVAAVMDEIGAKA